MKVLVVYDSVYGNTERIAQAIGNAIAGDVKLLRPAMINAPDIKMPDILFIGAPTYGGRPTPPVVEFITGLSKTMVNGHYIAAFDTRLSAKWVGVFGYAAGKIARRLKALGGILVKPPEGFIVKGTEGPLKEGELERATRWAQEIVEHVRYF